MKTTYYKIKEKILELRACRLEPTSRGFVMLFAVLVSSVLLSIGLSIFNLTVKELILSSSGRESQFAFYAADTGVECAIYWDFKGQAIFATSTSNTPRNPLAPDCVGTMISVANYPVARTSNTAATRFDVPIPNGASPYCAVVTVKKLALGGSETTRIDSRGYNTVCPPAVDLNRVERALSVCYGPDCATIDTYFVGL